MVKIRTRHPGKFLRVGKFITYKFAPANLLVCVNASLSKFARTFPNFQFKWTPAKGAKELHQAYTDVGLTHEDFLDRRFTRLKWLNYLLESNRLDGALRWQTSRVTPA